MKNPSVLIIELKMNSTFYQKIITYANDPMVNDRNLTQNLENFNLSEEKSTNFTNLNISTYYDSKNPIFIRDHFIDFNFPPRIKNY